MPGRGLLKIIKLILFEIVILSVKYSIFLRVVGLLFKGYYCQLHIFGHEPFSYKELRKSG